MDRVAWFTYGLILFVATALLSVGGIPSKAVIAQQSLDMTGTQWSPYLEWSLQNPGYEGNPYDLIAEVTFVHEETQETRTTQMFYAGENTWKFRFAGTQTGRWDFTTTSDDPDLNGHTGTVTIDPNPNPDEHGFVTHQDAQWVFSGSKRAFVPQFVMAGSPAYFYDEPSRIEEDIQTFMVDHGFNGLHTLVFCGWFDINQMACDEIDDDSPNPDLRTFAALEALITKVYEQGGVVHIWMWGDNSRNQNPSKFWGLNGDVDQRLQRYIAARLGPIPGWTMGYGFDLFEWTNENELTTWHDYMQDHLGWEHLLGARSSTNQLNQISEAMDYSSYEQHRPDYEMYVETLGTRPEKPSFSEDRFRVRNEGREKDYSFDDTRRGLWNSTMAGGVANIWGNVQSDDDVNNGRATSLPYDNADQIKTYALFFEDRFLLDMERCNDLTDGYCLRTSDHQGLIFYKENTSSIQLNLSELDGEITAIAVDTRAPYEEIQINLNASDQTWEAPHESDWAIAVGDFDSQ